MFSKLIRVFLGILGITRKRTLKYIPTSKADFLPHVQPGDICLTRSRKADLVQRGIEDATESVFQHALFIRSRSGKNIYAIEAIKEGVKKTNFIRKHVKKETQIECWHRKLTGGELRLLQRRADSMLGMPYDAAEIIHHVFPFFPHNDKLRVCSSLCTYIYKPIEKIVKRFVNPRKASPRDLRDYFVKSKKWTRITYGC